MNSGKNVDLASGEDTGMYSDSAWRELDPLDVAVDEAHTKQDLLDAPAWSLVT